MEVGSLGTVALWVAMVGSGVAIGVSITGGPVTLIRRAMVVGATAAWFATVLLAYALVSGDFSLVYVADTTSSLTPASYRVAALWGATEGSLLFLATLMATVGAFALRHLQHTYESLLRPAAIVIGAVVMVTLGAVATIASPFVRLAIPAIDGRGLLAILRHPAMLVHPPVLYFGHTILLVPFAVTVGALVKGRVDTAWLQLVRRWLIVSWTALTLGMLGGSMWAYVELGWGGFWAWDSVENSALLPWLATTAFLHTARLQLRSGAMVRWNAALAMLPFVLTVSGIYLTRSGLTGSVHAFAESTAVGRFTLLLAFCVTATAIFVLVRYPTSTPRRRPRSRREAWYLVNTVALLWIIVVVALGAGYPLVGGTPGDPTIVSPRWFVLMTFPAVMVVTAGIALSPWAGGHGLRRRVIRYGALSAASSLAMVLAGWRSPAPLLVGAGAAAAALTIGYELVMRRPGRRHLVAGVAHLGVAVLLIGAAGSSFGAEYHGGVSAGDEISVGDRRISVVTITSGSREDFDYVAAELAVSDGGGSGYVLTPEWRAYEGSVLPTPEPALRAGVRADVVAAISRTSDDAVVVWLDVFVRPLVTWVWVGAALIAVSGLLGLATSYGPAARQRRSATATRQPGGTMVGTSRS